MNDLLHGQKTGSTGPVECLGQTFPSEHARREHFTKLLAEKLKDPAFRKIEGFPQGTDEAILAMSDPPYYTACPNPFLEDFVRHYGKPYDPSVKYSREPQTIDVSVGKTDPIYKAHSYHTKVPHLAIVPSILHYTDPGDIVTVPVFIFTVLFGLSMDYHVFILTRIKEARDHGMSSNEAVARGIAITSGTITSAAAIMVVVFAVFVTLELTIIKQLGFGLAVAVFLDATIVRSVLLPASMRLLGEWNWWLPSWLAWLPHVTIEGTAEPAVSGEPAEPAASSAERAASTAPAASADR